MLILSSLLAFGLAIRLASCLSLPRDQAFLDRLPDQAGYLEITRNLLAGQGLKWHDARFDDDTVAVRMPGYPLFLAAMGGNVPAIRTAQALIDVSTILAVFLIARRWLGFSPSLLATAFVAFNPFLIYFSGLILTETLFTAMLVWSIVLLTSRVHWIWPAILLVASIHVRPSAIALPVILIFLARYSGTRQGEGRWTWLCSAGATVVLIVLVLFPWALRNRLILGQWIWTTTNGGFVAIDGFHPAASGASDQGFLSRPPWSDRLKARCEVGRNALLTREARRWTLDTLRDDPLALACLTAAKVARTWSPVPLSAEFGQRRLYLFAAILYAVPLFALAIVGLFAGPVPRTAKLLLIAPALYFTVIHALSVGSLRYRVPVEPLLAILAAAGVSWLAARLAKRTAS